MKKIKILIPVLLVLIIIIGIVLAFTLKEPTELRSIKSEKELEERYNNVYSSSYDAKKYIITMPFSMMYFNTYGIFDGPIYYKNIVTDDLVVNESVKATAQSTEPLDFTSTGRDYSTTNIQVENVDEADIIKTDGNYIYSISENNVIITDARDAENLKIASTISGGDEIPEDLIIYDNKLVIISAETINGAYYYNSNNNTIVKIYDITDKENPKTLKSYTMYEPYCTSRCINNKLYVISSGYLRKEDGKIITYYTENRNQKELGLNNIKYLTDIETKAQTLISYIDLNNPKEDVKINSYLIDISNAYVSENSIYLLNQKYEGRRFAPPIYTLFGIKGALGPFAWEDEDEGYGYYTDIYKFNILDNGEIEYKAKAKVRGQTINQYSLDEYESNLRAALTDTSKGSRVVVFDKNLKEIGTSSYLAKGEKMYSSRFIGNKAYLVTYKNMDPLFVIDLANPTNPTVLGELKIPGYSTYLHPYDEKYLIGIGMETKETVNRDAYGRVINTSSRVVGMKMALFDISDVENPKEVSNVVIGDSRTTSAILTNAKAFLFSKEKGIIAIPVNNYSEDFEITSSDSVSSLVNSYIQKSENRVSEGYFVYSINPEEGFTLKGTVTHEIEKSLNKYYYYYQSRLLRGLYIENDLYTVSENEIKVNELDTMKEISNLKIKGGE